MEYLAVDRGVAAAIQNQAFSALLFLYREVLEIKLEGLDVKSAKKGWGLPVVLSMLRVRL